MDIQQFSFGLILSLLMIFALNWIYFFDWLGLIGKIVGIIAPQKRDKEIEENRKLRKNELFKTHIKKWKLRFLLVPVIFSLAFSITGILFKNILFAYFFSLVIIAVAYGVLNKKETKERKTLIKILKIEIGDIGSQSV